VGDRPIFDARRRTPGNWAHFLNNHLPILFRLCDHEGLDPSSMLVVTPADTPDYIAEAAALFGIGIERIDAPVEGQVLEYEVEPWTGLRAARAEWVRSAAVRDLLALRLAAAPPPADPLPRRVFLSRNDTRRISNEAEIETLLARHGFRTVYPEQLSAADQFRLFEQAEIMVAIHGAGLAPLLYRPEGGLQQLVEILPCGHMTDVYRVMAEQVGCRWIGVRGRIKPAYVKAAYDLEARFNAFSLDSFEVDPVSLEKALTLISSPVDGEEA
jgi:capsular polysaccharide biosynthesis protein